MPSASPRVTAPIPSREEFVLRWLLVTFLALLLINWLLPFLARFGVGRLPGDLRFRLFGRECFVPLASTVLLTLVAGLLARLL